MDGLKEVKKGLELRGHRIFADVRKDIIQRLHDRKISAKAIIQENSTSCLIETDSAEEDDIRRVLNSIIQK